MIAVLKMVCLLGALTDLWTMCSGLDVSEKTTCDGDASDSASLLQVGGAEGKWCANKGDAPGNGGCCRYLSSVLGQFDSSSCSSQCQCAEASWMRSPQVPADRSRDADGTTAV